MIISHQTGRYCILLGMAEARSVDISLNTTTAVRVPPPLPMLRLTAVQHGFEIRAE